MQSITWLAIGYNVPANPSKNRVYIWRKLKEFGAGYFRPGVAILPKSSQNMANFRSLSSKIHEIGGDATIVEMRYCDPRDETKTIEKFRSQSEAEYRALTKDCADLMDHITANIFLPTERSERVKKVIRRYGKAKSRDYFKAVGRMVLPDMLDELTGDISDLGKLLRSMLD